MSEENKAAVRRMYQEMARGNHDVIDEIYSTDVIYHGPNGEMHGTVTFKELANVYSSAFSDMDISVEDLIAEGNKVVARILARATHTGDLMGIPATGKTIAVGGMAVFAFEDGKVVEEWDMSDRMGMMQQLGVIPT